MELVKVWKVKFFLVFTPKKRAQWYSKSCEYFLSTERPNDKKSSKNLDPGSYSRNKTQDGQHWWNMQKRKNVIESKASGLSNVLKGETDVKQEKLF